MWELIDAVKGGRPARIDVAIRATARSKRCSADARLAARSRQNRSRLTIRHAVGSRVLLPVSECDVAAKHPVVLHALRRGQLEAVVLDVVVRTVRRDFPLSRRDAGLEDVN